MEESSVSDSMTPLQHLIRYCNPEAKRRIADVAALRNDEPNLQCPYINRELSVFRTGETSSIARDARADTDAEQPFVFYQRIVPETSATPAVDLTRPTVLRENLLKAANIRPLPSVNEGETAVAFRTAVIRTENDRLRNPFGKIHDRITC